MKLKVGEDLYDFDTKSLIMHEALGIKKHTGMTISGWWNALMEDDPEAVLAAIWLCKTRAGLACRYDDLKTLDFADISLEPDDAELEEVGDDEDPTEPVEEPTNGTSTPKPSGKST